MRLNKVSVKKISRWFIENRKVVTFWTILILLVLIISIILIELASLILIKKLGWNYEPAYLRLIKGYTSSNLVGGRTEYHSWGSWNVPHYTGRIANNCFDVTYKFNSYGARDKEREKMGKNRTIVLGDSFTEGWGVDQDKILAANLEKLSGNEYLNFGIAGSGSGPLTEYILYRDFASQFEHDAVLVGFYLGNDFKDNDPKAWGGLTKMYYRPFWKLTEDKTDFEAQHFADKIEGKFLPGMEPENRAAHFTVFDNAREFSALMNLITVLKNYKISLSKESAQQFAYELDVPDDSLTANVLIYNRFSEFVGDKRKYVFIIPSATDVLYYVKTGKVKPAKVEQLKETLTKQGWRVIDTIDAFASLPEDKIPEHFICDGHWNDKGNKLAADYIYKAIKDDGVSDANSKAE